MGAIDPAEREETDSAGVQVVSPAGVARAVRGERVFLHLDFDILDPEVLPAGVPAPGGLSFDELHARLTELVGAPQLIGVEMTAFQAPADRRKRDGVTARVAEVVAPLMSAP